MEGQRTPVSPILFDIVVVGRPGPTFGGGGHRDGFGGPSTPSSRISVEFGIEHERKTVVERLSLGVVRAPALENSNNSVAVDPIVGTLGSKAAAKVGSRETAAFDTNYERTVGLRNKGMA